MPPCVQELHRAGLEFPVLIGGAAINRDFGRRALYPNGKESDEVYEPGVFYCKDAFEGLDMMDELVDAEARERAGREGPRRARRRCARRARSPRSPATTDDCVRSAARTDVPIPEPPFWGVREIEVDLDEVFPHLDRHVLFKLHWGGRGVKGEAWRELVEDGGFRPRLERMWREQDYLHPRALLGYFPCNADGNELVVLDPDDRERELERFVFPRQPKDDRICLADFFRPKDQRRARRDRAAGGHRRLRGHRADGPARARRRVRRAALRARPRRADGRGPGRVAALEGPRRARHPRHQGRRYSLGLPGLPEQSEHEKVDGCSTSSRSA